MVEALQLALNTPPTYMTDEEYIENMKMLVKQAAVEEDAVDYLESSAAVEEPDQLELGKSQM